MGKYVAILGTRGIPNNYGGFEQFAQYLSAGLAERGHRVVVYNPHHHPYAGSRYGSVEIAKIFDPARYLRSGSQFVYDYLCLRDALRRKVDAVIELGYQSSAVSLYLCPVEDVTVITNMDGMEWQRRKWGIFVKLLTRWFEKLAVKKSDIIVADSEEIRKYYASTYDVKAVYIPYGAVETEKFDENIPKEMGLEKYGYALLIARLEPENNTEMILEGFLRSEFPGKLVVIGNTRTRFGTHLQRSFGKNRKILFAGTIYDVSRINSLRHYSALYYHGHSIGGTNPSLLEAMAASAFIVAHDNPYNREVLRSNAWYFSDADDVAALTGRYTETRKIRSEFSSANLHAIKTRYNWEGIIDKYERIIESGY